MAKAKHAYICNSCGFETAKWVGKCPNCNKWNTFSEEMKVSDKLNISTAPRKSKATPSLNILDTPSSHHTRLNLEDNELNRVLGGGLVAGSTILMGGEPGIGKSTLMLQLVLNANFKTLYVSGEESIEQIKMRADRLGINSKNCFIYTGTQVDDIINEAKKQNPLIIIIDSIQTISSSKVEFSHGSITQLRESTAELIHFAKSTGISMFIIGHITKEGQIAGPKLLEHMVDTVLQFEGDRHYTYRILRTIKNRFGSTSELGIYDMNTHGLRPVDNPSEILLTHRTESMSGIAVSASLEGIRPLLIESQALVSNAVYGSPQRTATGYNLKRLSMILAVLEKQCGFKLGAQDAFVNIAGGIKIDDPGVDLGIAAAIISSFQNMAIPQEICFAGEIGLSGEVRAVNRVEQRIAEAERLGFKTIVISKYSKLSKQYKNIKVIQVSKVIDVAEWLFG